MAESYVTTLLLLDENKILADLNSVAIDLGLINNVFETSRIYIYYAVFARVLGNLTQTIAEYLSNLDFETTTDEALLDQILKPFLKKKNAKVAKVILEFSRREENANLEYESSNIFIPREFEVMTQGNDPIIFRTAESRILWKDSSRVLIPAYSVTFGSINNVLENTLIYFEDNETYLTNEIKVTNPFPAYGGRDEETAFDTRQRIDFFRYGRDGSKDFLQQLIFDNGVSYYGFNIEEYWDGAGTVLIALDIPSEDEYNDIVQSIEASKREGVKYSYCRVQHIYINVDVVIKITGDNLYTEYQIDEVEQHVFTAVKLFFDNNIQVGKKLSKNRLEAYILQYLVDERYDIYDIDLLVESNSNVRVDPNTGQFLVNPFERMYPNQVFTRIEYNQE